MTLTMKTVNRKSIEEFYEKEWSSLISSKTIKALIELTCKAYQLNQPLKSVQIQNNDHSKPFDLGRV